jgi:hypothetical protein
MRPIAAVIMAGVLVFAASLAGAHPHSPSGDRSKDNRDAWIALGEAVHGGFGALIALGIRIGDDAIGTLGAGPRQLDVTYYSGPAAPCPCIVDGIMIVTVASPGQGTLRVAMEAAAEGQFGRAVIRHRRTGEGVEYIIPTTIAPLVADANRGDPDRRWTLIMDAPAERLFAKRRLRPGEN